VSGGFDVAVARTGEEVDRLEPLWARVAWGGEQAEHPYYAASIRLRAPRARPFAVIVCRDGAPVAAAAGRIEKRRLDTRVGYLTLFAPTLRVLQVVPGGIVAQPDAVGALVTALGGALRRDADALSLPALPVDAPVAAAVKALAGPLERQRLIPAWTGRRLVLPESFEAFLATRTRKIRFGVRYDAKKLVDALGDDLELEIARDASTFDRLVADLEQVASATYQRALGAGFADTVERRALLRLSLEHGWARAYVLRHAREPIAFWLCSVHDDTITLTSTGYLPAYARYRPGIYVLMRVIEDACEDPALRVLDFGPGRSGYKRHFSSEGYEETNVLVFAPTLRGRSVNVVRTAILGTAALGRRTLDRLGLTDRLRTAWRGSLRRARA
jgi:CelD/BcsL family acetyltransferase involved in cellulose biosynthesis